ncbi:RNase adapter RapZ [Laribacter hongkongensis]|uniref:RNase adapter RapZ n=1 Tax=Laribacter hongkongensis TaxID=168471 RepID=UPI001EFCA722|nr:RNase adapter RapZ [Laribacter hongkongensis]MCG9116017.1 RNase adapter RapZ [Laribacter hongkongensis]
MQLILISGLAGSGKSIALNVLEDSGYSCIDNLPLTLVPDTVERLAPLGYEQLAISLDTRDGASRLLEVINSLETAGHNVRFLFLEARTDTLIRRFSETRRRHPLSRTALTIPEAIARERQLLQAIAGLGHRIDTSDLSPNQLRRYLRDVIAQAPGRMLVVIQSFGFKHGVPLDADFVFDVRCLPNPYYDPALRPFTGRDAPIINFLTAEPLVQAMADELSGLTLRWIPVFRHDNRNYLTFAIGCTGGQHRSVYLAETLAARLRETGETVLLRHRELDR